MIFIYELVLWLLAIVAFPKLLYDALFYGKYRKSFLQRCGKGFPEIQKGNRQLIWVHAVSMGETKAVAALVKSLKAQRHHPLILISSVTETGHAEAKKSMPEADYHVYLPYDFKGIISPLVAKTNPDMLLISENDCWANFLHAAKKCGAYIALVNGKLSERSQKRFQWFPQFAKTLFGSIDLFCLQSEHYQKRFEALGIAKEKMVVTGNLKFDDALICLNDSEKNNLRTQWGIGPSNKVLVIGSSHDPEERLLLEVMEKVWAWEPTLKVIIIPRHPERFNAVAALLESMKIPFGRHSQKANLSDRANKVVLIDAMGMLRNTYQIADVAIVAGSYTPKVGGHNIIEPLWCGVPTIFGPYMHTQPELVEIVSRFSAGLQLPLENLEGQLRLLLKEIEPAASLQRNGLNLVASMRGSTERTLAALTSR